ncbi:MAG TPA: FAD-dependent oxidoreductase [Candidatus Dormibacteraeota bacterium]|nr:FAD-dependent oxidoreductase [Candidatus Dormibacteraeota bacterium]
MAEDEEAAREPGRRAELQRAAGLPIEHPDPCALVPGLALRRVLATNFCRLDGVYLPARILDCLIEEARAAGVELRYGVQAGPRELRVEAMVVCAGTWSREVGARLDVRPEVTPVERGVFQVGAFDWLTPMLPMTLDAGTGYHVREREGRLLVIGPGDPNEWAHHREWLARWLPAAAVERPEGYWTSSIAVSCAPTTPTRWPWSALASPARRAWPGPRSWPVSWPPMG